MHLEGENFNCRFFRFSWIICTLHRKRYLASSSFIFFQLVVIAMSLWDKRKETGFENQNRDEITEDDQQEDTPEVESGSTAGSTHGQLEDSADHVNVLTDYGKSEEPTYRSEFIKSFELYSFQDFKEMSKMDKLMYG